MEGGKLQIRYSIWSNEHAWASSLLLILAIILATHVSSVIRSDLNRATAELAAYREAASHEPVEVECAP